MIRTRITKKSCPWVYRICKHAFPDYAGRKFSVCYENTIDTGYNANWDGGSRTYYKFVRIDNGKILDVPEFMPWKRPQNETVELPIGAVCVTHTFFCGHDMGLMAILSDKNQMGELIA